MIDELIRLSVPLEAFASSRPSGPYREVGESIRFAPDSETDRPLCNFTAQIVCDVVLDNGVDTSRVFEILATHRGRTYRFTVPAEKFASLNWVLEHLGASAIVYPGLNTRQHCPVAIQSLSGDIPERREYTHTGWATVDGQKVYLTSEGAIGAGGLDRSVVVKLSGSLGRYRLLEPPAGTQFHAAVRASLGMLEVAPLEVTAPIFAAIYRAPLGQPDFSLHLSGQTGTGKSELSALGCQHFGPELNARNLPASWSSTANANEAQGFAAKDVLLAIDDFAPTGSQGDVQRLHRDADRLFRGTGNGSGRMRMRADTTLQEGRRVRAMLLSSGEDVPKGESLRARLLAIDLELGAMNWARLSKCQADAAAGRYAEAIAGYVQWLAQHPNQFERFRRLQAEYRDLASSASDHKRTPAIVADLAGAVRIFCDFATDSGVLTATDADALWSRLWKALTLTASRQSALQAQNEPTRVFREYLGAAITAGLAHIAAVEGSQPENARAFGWRILEIGGFERAQPQGACIGWITPDGLLLEPKAAYMAAQSMAQRAGESIGTTEGRLKKSLNERGLLLSTESQRQTLTIRKRIGGRDMAVLHVAADFIDTGALITTGLTKPTNSSQSPSNDAANPLTGTETEPTNPREEPAKPTNVQPFRNGCDVCGELLAPGESGICAKCSKVPIEQLGINLPGEPGLDRYSA